MSTVQLIDQSEEVKRLIEQAESGGTVSIVKDGREVAKIVPTPVELRKSTKEERDAAMQRLMALMEKGLDLGGVWPGRDVIYDEQ